MTRPVLVDAAVFLYAIGGPHELRDPCRRVVADSSLELCASVEMVQEVAFHRLRVTERFTAVEQAQQVAESCRLLPFDQEVLSQMLQLISQGGVGGRDAVHAATALVHGIAEIVSPDQDFDSIAGLARIDPADFD